MKPQLRERLHEIIFDGLATDSAGAAPTTDSQNLLPDDSLSGAPRSGGRTNKNEPLHIHTCSSRDAHVPAQNQGGTSEGPLFYSLPGSAAPGVSRVPEEEGFVAHGDPDLVWINDSLLENLMSRLYPEDPSPGNATEPRHFSGCEVRPKKTGEWDSLVQSADKAQYPVFAIDRSRKVIVWNTAIEQTHRCRAAGHHRKRRPCVCYPVLRIPASDADRLHHCSPGNCKDPRTNPGKTGRGDIYRQRGAGKNQREPCEPVEQGIAHLRC